MVLPHCFCQVFLQAIKIPLVDRTLFSYKSVYLIGAVRHCCRALTGSCRGGRVSVRRAHAVRVLSPGLINSTVDIMMSMVTCLRVD